MVEHLSKCIELVASPDKANERAAYDFVDRMVNHFDARTKVLINLGIKFQVLYDKMLIYPRTTSRDHPKPDD